MKRILPFHRTLNVRFTFRVGEHILCYSFTILPSLKKIILTQQEKDLQCSLHYDCFKKKKYEAYVNDNIV